MNDLKMGRRGLVTIDQVKQWLKNDKPHLLLDIRSASDYNKNHHPAAEHCEWSSVTDLITADRLPKDKPIVVICYNGQSSMQVSTVLNLQGYDAYSLLDGWDAWSKDY